VTLDDGSAVILSVASILQPGGKAIQDTGVTPNVAQVETDAAADSDDDNAPDTPELRLASPHRPDVQKAIETVSKK